jgi:Na+-transporting methylmalonyl-CoA/oxaloacetate decarboxylase gamma subunit
MFEVFILIIFMKCLGKFVAANYWSKVPTKMSKRQQNEYVHG